MRQFHPMQNTPNPGLDREIACRQFESMRLRMVEDATFVERSIRSQFGSDVRNRVNPLASLRNMRTKFSQYDSAGLVTKTIRALIDENPHLFRRK